MRLLHITDLHFWHVACNPLQLLNKRFLGNLNLVLRRRHHLHTDRAQSFIDLLDSIRPDGVLVGGDVSTTALAEEFEQAAAFLAGMELKGVPVFLLPGNHDYYTFESRRARRFERFLGRYATNPDTAAITMLPGQLPLLQVPTVRPNWLSSRGEISPEQVAQVAPLLGGTGSGPVLALAHYPCLEKTAVYASGFGRQLANASALRRALGQAGRPLLYLAGHVHVFSHTRDSEYPSLTHVTSNALFYEKRDREAGFTEIEVEPGQGFRIFPWHYRDGWKRGAESVL